MVDFYVIALTNSKEFLSQPIPMKRLLRVFIIFGVYAIADTPEF